MFYAVNVTCKPFSIWYIVEAADVFNYAVEESRKLCFAFFVSLLDCSTRVMYELDSYSRAINRSKSDGTAANTPDSK